MTLVASVAAGSDSADTLQLVCRQRITTGEISFVRHGPIAAAWAADSPWLDVYDDGDVLTVLDGRLHNVAISASGHAQLILSRYREQGPGVATGLLGDFVVIVLDRSRGSLLVARDPVGVRPWYLATNGRRHAGASELNTLTCLPWVDTEVDERIAIEYLAAVFESRGETLYRGISSLAPGATWLHDGSRTRTLQHHRWDLEPDLDISWDAAAERCRIVLTEAVRSRLNVGGPPTCLVSGGLDSSAVVGTAMLLGNPDVLVGRLIFDRPRADERSYSDAVLGHWGVPAVSAPPWMPTEEESWELTRRFRRPVPDPHFTMFIGLQRTLHEMGRLDGLTGLGGDDAFVTSSIGSRVLSSIQLRQWTVLGRLAGWTARNPRHAWPELVRPALHYVAWWKGDRRPPWVSGTAAAQAELADLSRRRPAAVTGISAIDERIANLTSGYDAAILEALAVLGDLVGSRESHPFLDPRFVVATYGLDPWWPVRGGHTRALQVAALADRLPPLVAQRRSKADFSEVFWPQLLDEHVVDQVRTGPLRAFDWLDLDGFNTLVGHAKEGKANAAIPLSRCVSLDRWLRQQ